MYVILTFHFKQIITPVTNSHPVPVGHDDVIPRRMQTEPFSLIFDSGETESNTAQTYIKKNFLDATSVINY